MRFKRAGSAVLAAALAATSMGIYADAEEDAAMKKAMTYVKQRIEIPENLKEFNYRTYTDNGATSYRFTWSDPNAEKNQVSSINVTITGSVVKSCNINTNGNYYDYDDDVIEGDAVSFAKLSDSKLISACKKYIKQLNPGINKNVKTDDESFSISLWGNNATLGFHREANGVPVTGQTGYVTVNKNTGELIGYYFNWINGASFSSTKNAISEKDAQKAFKKLFPTELIYTLYYDWENDEFTPHLIYRQTQHGQINAFTGKLSTFEDYDSYDDGEDGDDDIAMETADADDANPATGASSNKAVTFTQAEIEKMEIEDKLIKADTALKNLMDMGIFYIPASSTVTSQSCGYNEREKRYYRSVRFSAQVSDYVDLNDNPIKPLVEGDSNEWYEVYGSFQIDAQSGELQHFYCWANDDGSNMDEKATAEKADEIAKKLLGDKLSKDFGKLENTYSSKRYEQYDYETGKPIGEPRITSMIFSANREAYGIKCAEEDVDITISNNGYVTSYDLNYNENVTYPKPDNIISVSKAYSKFFSQCELGLRYRCAYRTKDKKVVSALVYAADKTMYIDAFTGKLTYADGRELDINADKGEYTDLKDSKYKTYAEKLKKYGITLMDEKGRLNENATITVGDFKNLFSNLGVNTYALRDLDDTAKLDRKTGAKIFVIGKYGKGVAQMTSIFKAKFSDVLAGSEYIGYIAISDAAGFIKGSGSKFSPDAKITRGEALRLAYDLLS